jgi:hypothetical protein
MNEVMANGDGSARLIKTREVWMLEGIPIEIDDSRGDHEYVQDLANENDFFAVGITYASGTTYQGDAQLVGEMKYTSKTTMMPISLSGPGNVTPQ